MGWREFQGHLAARVRQQQGPEPDPHSWAGTENDPQWQEMRAIRDRKNAR